MAGLASLKHLTDRPSRDSPTLRCLQVLVVVGDARAAGREDGEEGEGDVDGADDRPGRRRKAGGRTADPSSTLAATWEELNQKKFDLAFAVDPLFHKTSAQFDEGGARGAQLVGSSGTYTPNCGSPSTCGLRRLRRTSYASSSPHCAHFPASDTSEAVQRRSKRCRLMHTWVGSDMKTVGRRRPAAEQPERIPRLRGAVRLAGGAGGRHRRAAAGGWH